MLGHAIARKPAPMLAWSGIGLRLRRVPVALGNALGQGLVDAASGPSQSQPSASASDGRASSALDMEPMDYSLASGRLVQLGGGTVEPAVESFVDSDNYDLMGTPRQVGAVGKNGARGAWGIAQSLAGDGASNAEVNRIKNQLLALNPELADGAQKGQRYYVPDESTPENLSLARSADARFQTDLREHYAARVEADLAAHKAYLGRNDGELREWVTEQFELGTQGFGDKPLVGVHASPDIRAEWKNTFEDPASITNDLALGAQLSLLGAAKYDSLTILQRAAPLHSSLQLSIGTAESLDDAGRLLRSPTGKAATSLAEAGVKYGTAIRGLGYVGAAATVVEETAFVLRSPDGTRLNAYGSSMVNIAGDAAATTGGFWLGASIGAAIGGPFAPVTIPLVGAVGGFGAHWAYDVFVKPDVRGAFTGAREPD